MFDLHQSFYKNVPSAKSPSLHEIKKNEELELETLKTNL